MRRRVITALLTLVILCVSPLLAFPKQKAMKSKTPTDWSVAMVESTMKRYPTTKDLGTWGYAKALYLYGQYLVYKRTHEPKYLQYIKDWIDSHVDDKGVVINTNAQGVTSQIKYDSLDSMSYCESASKGPDNRSVVCAYWSNCRLSWGDCSKYGQSK